MDGPGLEARVRRMYEAFARGDADAYRASFADDVVWHVPGDNPVSGAYRGHDGYFGTMPERMAPLEEWAFTVTDVAVNEKDDAALVRFHLTGRRKGATVDMDGWHMVRLAPDGRIAEGWGFTSDQDSLDQFFWA
jgi:ketosteroid isomerase-like protein